MKPLQLMLSSALVLATLLSGGFASAHTAPAPASTPAATYVCPMDPDVTSNKPGVCKKCGMNLVKVVKTKKVRYVCPMDPDVVSDKPGVCKKCGMTLEKQTEK